MVHAGRLHIALMCHSIFRPMTISSDDNQLRSICIDSEGVINTANYECLLRYKIRKYEHDSRTTKTNLPTTITAIVLAPTSTAVYRAVSMSQFRYAIRECIYTHSLVLVIVGLLWSETLSPQLLFHSCFHGTSCIGCELKTAVRLYNS